MIHDIPFSLRLRLENLLEQNEKVEWCQIPLLKRVLRRKSPVAIAGVFLFGFSAFIFSLLSDNFKETSGPGHAFSSFFVVMLIPFSLISLILIFMPVYTLLINHKSLYILTNKRALILSKTLVGYTITSRHFGEMNHIDKEIDKKGEGDIWFYKSFFIDKNGKKNYSYEGFIGIENAKEIHKHLIKKIKEAKDNIEAEQDLSANFAPVSIEYLPEYLRLKLDSIITNNENIEIQFQPAMGPVLRRSLPRMIPGIFMLALSYYLITYVMNITFTSFSIHLITPILIFLVVFVQITRPILSIYAYAKGLYIITEQRIILLRKTLTGCREKIYNFKDMVNIHAIREDKQGNGDLSFRLLLRNQANKNRDNFTDIYLSGITNVRKVELFIKQRQEGTSGKTDC